MLSYSTHPDEIKEIQDQISSGKFFSIVFVKKDGSIRFMNGHKKYYVSDSPDTEKRGKWNRKDKNILLVWDRNAVNKKTGEKGALRSVPLQRLLFVKVGNFIRDYTDENIDTIKDFDISPDQINQIKQKLKINEMIQEEIYNFLQKSEFSST